MTAGAAPPLAVLLPGILMPAFVRYAPLIGALSPEVRAAPKELEVYAHDVPPDDYSVATELDGLTRFLDKQGVDRIHLYGHSAGASVALAYTAEHPERVLSLALDEPATDFSDEDRAALRGQFPERLEDLPAADRMRVFVTSLVRPNVQLSAPTPPPPGPESAKRPQGMLAFEKALYEHEMDVSAVIRFPGPVYFSYGSLCSSRWEQMSARVSSWFPAAAWSGTTACTTSTPRTRPSRPGSPTRCTSSGADGQIQGGRVRASASCHSSRPRRRRAWRRPPASTWRSRPATSTSCTMGRPAPACNRAARACGDRHGAERTFDVIDSDGNCIESANGSTDHLQRNHQR